VVMYAVVHLEPPVVAAAANSQAYKIKNQEA
jgi:hypothetical protein